VSITRRRRKGEEEEGGEEGRSPKESKGEGGHKVLF